jgi:ribose 5-phosphate isomerase RpiB
MRITIGSDHAGVVLEAALATGFAGGRHGDRVAELAALDPG